MASLGFLTVVLTLGLIGVWLERVRSEAKQREAASYVTRIRDAKNAWEHNDIATLREKLEPDLDTAASVERGWEWYYLYGLPNHHLNRVRFSGQLRDIDWSPDGAQLAVLGRGAEVIILNSESLEIDYRYSVPGQSPGTFNEVGSGRNIAWSANGEYVAVSVTMSSETTNNRGGILFRQQEDSTHVVVQDSETGRVAEKILTASPGLAWSGQNLVVTKEEAVAHAITMSDPLDEDNQPRITTMLDYDRPVDAFSTSSDGGYIAFHSENVTHIRRMNGNHAGERWVGLDELHEPTFSAFNPVNTHLATASEVGQVHLWDIKGRRLERVLAAECSPFTEIEWSADGKHLAASQATSVFVWDVVSGQLKAHLRGHEAEVTGIAWSQGDSRLASVSLDGTVRVWDVNGYAPQYDRVPSYRSIEWSPDSSTILFIESLGRFAALFDVQSKEARRLPVAMDRLRALAWSPSGDRFCVLHSRDPQELAIFDKNTLESWSCNVPAKVKLTESEFLDDNRINLWTTQKSSLSDSRATDVWILNLTSKKWASEKRMVPESEDRDQRLGYGNRVASFDRFSIIDRSYRRLELKESSDDDVVFFLDFDTPCAPSPEWSPNGKRLSIRGRRDDFLLLDASAGLCKPIAARFVSAFDNQAWPKGPSRNDGPKPDFPATIDDLAEVLQDVKATERTFVQNQTAQSDPKVLALLADAAARGIVRKGELIEFADHKDPLVRLHIARAFLNPAVSTKELSNRGVQVEASARSIAESTLVDLLTEQDVIAAARARCYVS